jgi:N4-gp56 family major capsid protein
MPVLSEHGGRVNRVGFKRIELQGSLEKFGFFDEYTQESMDFDTDADLMMHINREMLRGANEITEDALQIDLLNSAGVVRFGGDATSRPVMEAEAATGETIWDDATNDVISYDDLMRLSIDLDNNRCPKNTKIITGSRMIDTRTIDGARYMYVGSELLPMLKSMEDNFGNPAFIPVHQYGAAATLATGEVGSIDQFRIIVVPEMMHWAGAGAAAGGNPWNCYQTGGNYDVFPMLVVGDESFTTIGFQTDGKTVKFKITHKKPGAAVADRDDPYGEVGFMSIKWYYGFMVLRPERIALCQTVAPM